MVIAFCNQKGGVGKTTAVANVGWVLAHEQGEGTILVDLNPQGTLSNVLEHDAPERSLCEWMLDQGAPLEGAAGVVDERLAVMEGTRSLATEGSEVLKANVWALAERLAATRGGPRWWIIDTPPELSSLTVGALCAADGVVVVTQVFAESVVGLVQLLETVEQVREARGGGEAPRLLGILPTFVQSRPRLHAQILAELERRFPGLLLPSIPYTVAVQYAALERRPVVAAEPEHRVSHAFRRATREIVRRVGGEPHA